MKLASLPSIKMTILGESTTGKTSIAYRLVKNIFSEYIESTIGASFLTLYIEDKLKIEIWDTAGQERYLSLVPMYYRNADLILMVFDLSQLNTVDRIAYYIEKIDRDLGSNCKIMIIGNKLDLIDESSQHFITEYVKNKLKDFKQILNHVEFINVSTKTGKNFDILTKKIIEMGIDQAHKKKVIALQNNTNSTNNIITLNTSYIPIESNGESYRDKLTKTYNQCSC